MSIYSMARGVGKVINKPRNWGSREKLPKGFAKWLGEIIREQEIHGRKGYFRISEELGIPPSILSRWIAGWGPLNQYDINILAEKLGSVVYTFLLIPHPD